MNFYTRKTILLGTETVEIRAGRKKRKSILKWK